MELYSIHTQHLVLRREEGGGRGKTNEGGRIQDEGKERRKNMQNEGKERRKDMQDEGKGGGRIQDTRKERRKDTG
jgi:hypothetical protein